MDGSSSSTPVPVRQQSSLCDVILLVDTSRMRMRWGQWPRMREGGHVAEHQLQGNRRRSVVSNPRVVRFSLQSVAVAERLLSSTPSLSWRRLLIRLPVNRLVELSLRPFDSPPLTPSSVSPVRRWLRTVPLLSFPRQTAARSPRSSTRC